MKITIIGAGPGGYETALAAAKRGFEVVLVEAGHVGGTCLNAGCIPTKSLCHSAQLLEDMLRAGESGIGVSGLSVDFSAVQRRKDEVIDRLRTGIETLLSSAGVKVVNGRAVILDGHTVEAAGEKWQSDYIIIASGSSPVPLNVPGADSPGVLDSTAILALDAVPQRLCVIGAGVVGLEMASVFRSFGSEVTVVEYCREILPRFDADIAKRLRKSLASRGIDFFLQAQVTGIFPAEEGASRVCWTKKGAEEECVADAVLMSVGRRPNCSGLGLENAGVGFSGKGIAVDGEMRTNVRSIFAIGDVNGRQMLAHAATWQGKVALQAILRENGMDSEDDFGKISLDVMPSAVFTLPEVASVGLSEEECKAQGLDFRSRKSFYRANGKALCMNEPEGICKLLEGKDGKILGCHVLGAHAAELVQEVSVLMSTGCGIEDLRAAVHIHPTLSELLHSAAE